MADAGVDKGESNVEKKYAPALFLPAGLRGELGSSEVNAELGCPGPGPAAAAQSFTVQYHRFHLVMDLFLLPVMSQERLMGS
jgi:hypothetical protein